VNATLPAQRPIEELTEATRAIRSAERALGAEGRVLVRWSGTEPKLRVMLEGPDESALRRYAEAITEAARRDLGAAPAGRVTGRARAPRRA
jgi:phosphoglucosamine mutase